VNADEKKPGEGVQIDIPDDMSDEDLAKLMNHVRREARKRAGLPVDGDDA